MPAYHKDGRDEADDEEEDATNIDLDFKATGLESFSGSGDDGQQNIFMLLCLLLEKVWSLVTVSMSSQRNILSPLKYIVNELSLHNLQSTFSR